MKPTKEQVLDAIKALKGRIESRKHLYLEETLQNGLDGKRHLEQIEVYKQRIKQLEVMLGEYQDEI